MSYTVSATDLKSIQFNEKNELNAVLQNIAVILSTPMGTVALYRDFGLDWSFLDKPTTLRQILDDKAEAIQRWEPRATVLDVSFSEDPAQPGVLIPTVEVDINLE